MLLCVSGAGSRQRTAGAAGVADCGVAGGLRGAQVQLEVRLRVDGFALQRHFQNR